MILFIILMTLQNSYDAMMSYLGGDITASYQELGEYIQAKMELICGIIEGSADNSTAFAIGAEDIDKNASDKAWKGETVV